MPKERIFFLSFFCTLHFAQSKDSGLTFRPYPPVYRTSMALSVRLTSWSRSHDTRAAARKNLASPLRRWTRGRTRGHDTYQAGEREADIFLRACATKTEEKKKEEKCGSSFRGRLIRTERVHGSVAFCSHTCNFNYSDSVLCNPRTARTHVLTLTNLWHVRRRCIWDFFGFWL